jgi:CPA1 family monovalent cation:H+ antiporter
VFPAAYIPLLLSRRIREREGVHSPRAVFLTGWAGIRGSITLAAALSIPFATSTGQPFPDRELIILLAASVIIVTLLLNGSTLPLLIRWLDIRGDRIAEGEERAARMATTQAAIESLRKRLPRLKSGEETAFANSLLSQYEQKLRRYSANAERKSVLEAQHATQRRIWLAAIAAERAELMQMRETDVINDDVLRRLQVDLDLEETRVAGVARDAI